MLSLLALLLVAAPTDTTRHPTVIVVRHAEKASETDRDPSLSDIGRARAAALDSVLADAHVTAIVVTQFKRTAETAALVAARHHLTPIVVATGSGGDAHAAAVAKAAMAQDGVVLVVGHSNTVPAIVHALGGPRAPDLCDKSYAQLFTVSTSPAPAVVRSRFGVPDAPGADQCGGMAPR